MIIGLNRNFISIKYRYAFFISIFVLTVIVIISLFVYNTQKKGLITALENKGKITVKMLGNIAIEPMMMGNYTQLQNVIEDLSSENDLEYILFVNNDNKVMNCSIDPKTQKSVVQLNKVLKDQISMNASKATLEYLVQHDIEKDLIDIAFPLIKYNKQWGLVRLGFSLKFVLEEVRKIQKNMIIMAIISILVSVIVSIPLSNMIVKPINNVVAGLRNIAESEGDLTPIIKNISMNDNLLKAKSEIGIMARSFNKMRLSLLEKVNELKKAEEKYRSIFENSAEGIFQVTPEGRFLSANLSMAKLLGYNSSNELITSVPNIINELYVNPEDRKRLEGILRKEGMNSGYETQFYKKTNERFHGSLSVRCVYDEKGELLYYEGSLVDLTERYEREKAERKRGISEAINQKLMESLRYAEMIQRSLLPGLDVFKTYLPDSFVMWSPRDIVGGDIIFAYFPAGKGIVGAVVDCTGHGVPGAFMSMIASSGLRKIISGEGCNDPSKILKKLNSFVKTSLQQDTEQAKSDDGMDVSLCFMNPKEQTLTFSGAKLPLIYIHNDKLTVIKGDKQSIGYRRSDLNFDFTNHTIRLQEGMSFYMYSDGITDQLGGEKRRMFGSKRFKNLLKDNYKENFDRQREIITEAFQAHKGDEERQDDVTVVGFNVDKYLQKTR